MRFYNALYFVPRGRVTCGTREIVARSFMFCIRVAATITIKVLCEQTREANKRNKIFFRIICLVLGILCLIFMFRVQKILV